MTCKSLAVPAVFAAAAVALGGCAANARPTGTAQAVPPPIAVSATASTPVVPPVSPIAPAMPLSAADANLQAWSGTVRFEHPQAGAMPDPAPASGRSPVGASAPYARAFIDGTSYRLATSPERVSDIMLQPGETLISVAAGDTARWVIGDTASGAGAERRIHVLVKPSAVGLRTNLVITTDRRVYHVELESNARPGAARLAWTYPAGDIIALGAPSAPAAPTPTADLVLDALNFGYRIDGDAPAWRPIRAFDDGRQVFIEFPPNVERGEVPPLFVLGAGGAGELVNYRQRGRFYVVDRLFESAELRMGQRRQQVVRITRGEAGRQARGRRS